MYNSFQIFIPDYNKFTLSINLVYYPLLAVFIILFLNLLLEPYHSIINFILIFFAIIYIYLGATRPFRTKPIKGKLEGLILFEKESLVVNNIRIDISEIQSIELSVGDFMGELYRYNHRSPNLNGVASNGTNNWIEYCLKNGVNNKIFFRKEFEAQHETIYPFLKTLIKTNILTLTQVLTIIDFESEYNIQCFKDSLNK